MSPVRLVPTLFKGLAIRPWYGTVPFFARDGPKPLTWTALGRRPSVVTPALPSLRDVLGLNRRWP